MQNRRARSAARLGTADSTPGMRPSASTPGLGVRVPSMRPSTAPDGGLPPPAFDLGSGGGLSASASSKSLLKKGEVVHTKPWEPTKLFRVHTPNADVSLRTLLADNRGAQAGRLTSEDYGQGMGFDPGVRRKVTPGLKPRHTWQILDAKAEAEKRRRPRSSVESRHDPPQQQWTAKDSGKRSSDAIGAGARPEPVLSKWPLFQRKMMMREKSAAELNYLAQVREQPPLRARSAALLAAWRGRRWDGGRRARLMHASR